MPQPAAHPPGFFNLSTFLDRLDMSPELAGNRVVYFDGFRMHILRVGPQYCAPGLQAVVIRKPIETTALVSADAAATRDGKLLAELLGVGLSCSAAVIGWSVVLGSGAAAPLTGGGSTFVAYLAGTAAAASSVQCINSLARSWVEYDNPAWLDELDRKPWYQRTSIALDGISLAGAATAGAATIRLALTLRASTGKSMVAVLKGLTRQQRKKLAEEIIRTEHRGISNGQLKVLVRAGVYPRRFTQLEITNSVRRQLLDAAGAAASFAGSATSGVVREGGGLVIGLARSLETYR